MPFYFCWRPAKVECSCQKEFRTFKGRSPGLHPGHKDEEITVVQFIDYMNLGFALPPQWLCSRKQHYLPHHHHPHRKRNNTFGDRMQVEVASQVAAQLSSSALPCDLIIGSQCIWGGYQNSVLRVRVLVVVRVGSKTFFTLQTGLKSKGAGG